jgi:hypothetical protein
MLYSPLDSPDPDDFSHLPTVDGAPAAPTPRQPTLPSAEQTWEGEEVPPEEAEWQETPEQEGLPLPEELSVPEEQASEDTIESEIKDEDGDGDEPDTEDLPAAQDDVPLPQETGLIQPVEPGEPEAPADNSPQIHEAKKRAFILAVGVHLLLLLIFAIIQVAPVTRPASEIVAISSSDTEEQPSWKKIAPPTPAASGGPSIQPIVALGSSQVAMPDVDFTPTATELNVGSSFGTFGGGSGTAGGNVSFMGNQGKGSRVVFVVDVSGSMSASSQVDGKTISRMDLLKKELVKSLNQLRGGVQYQVLYFSDFAWPHDEVDTNDAAAMAKYEWSIRPGQQGVRIPRYRYLPATPANLAKSRKIIEDSSNPGGTNWGSGLLMALNGSPKPDLVFFMTDGNKSDALTWVDEVTTANAKGKPATIHTTALMAPGAAQDLDELARRNQGKFTVIEADGKVIKGADFFKANGR